MSYTALQVASAQSLQNGVSTHAFFGGTVGALILWGIFWSVAVDWDLLIQLALSKSLKMNWSLTHRKFPSHAPSVWLFASLTVYFLTTTTYGHYFALMMFLGSWFHLALDSIEYGVMWLWPFSKKLYALLDNQTEKRPRAGDESVFAFYWNTFRNNIMKTITFRAEVVATIVALVFLLSR